MGQNRVFIGFDGREKITYDICKFSIEFNTFTKPKIIPLVHKELRRQGLFSRPWLINAYDGNFTDLVDGKPFSTEFSHTRFLVPKLCNYEGWALFMDCDMVFDSDIKELFKLTNDKYAAMVVKHRHNPKNRKKMDGVPQTNYFRKNWSSFMLFNCGHPANKVLTPELVSTKDGSWLHALTWLEDHQIGELPETYNWIEGFSKSNIKPDVIHYTEGSPNFDGYKDVIHADVWWKYYNRYLDSGEHEPLKETLTVNYGV